MNRSSRLLWTSVGVSSFGSALTEVALPLLALFVVGVSPAQLGVAVAVDQLAWSGLGLFAGVWVDRWSRRTVLVASDLGGAVLVAALPVAYFLGELHLWLLLVVGLLVGVCTVFAGIAGAAVVPELVDCSSLVAAHHGLRGDHRDGAGVSAGTGPGAVGLGPSTGCLPPLADPSVPAAPGQLDRAPSWAPRPSSSPCSVPSSSVRRRSWPGRRAR